MGTSGSNAGQGAGTPLYPTWLDAAGTGGAPPAGQPPTDGVPTPDGEPPAIPPAPPPRPPLQIAPEAARFKDARGNFSRFARSGGSDRTNLGRALSRYVSTTSGGSRQAAQRMGSSRTSGAKLLGFLSDVQNRGVQEALRTLNLGALAGRPIEEIFLGLADYVCPEGGTIDDGIARDAFIETIADLAGLGIADLDALTPDQMQTVFEIYATHAIEARIFNDIGLKSVKLPTDVRAVERVQAELHDFIRRGVSDALAAAAATVGAPTPQQMLGFVTHVYEAAFNIIQILGEAEEGQ